MACFDFFRRPKNAVFLTIFGLTILALFVQILYIQDSKSLEGRLAAPPSEDGVWIVGNSIFQTGVDSNELSHALGDVPVDFEYHGGHYTSLWYLIFKNALPDLERKPAIIIWGYRPQYASQPAFRQNVRNSTEQFLMSYDSTYEQLTGRFQPGSVGILERGADLVRILSERTALWKYRTVLRDALSNFGLRLGAFWAEFVDSNTSAFVRREILDGDLEVVDVLTRVTSNGSVKYAAARVDERFGDFITGPTVSYSDSFVPIIADLISDAGIKQLVVLWPPRGGTHTERSKVSDMFVSDSLADLQSRGIPVLNLYDDERFSDLAFFAAGDHFNQEGQILITSLLARELGAQGLGN